MYGETLRKIRLKKGLTQKEVYENIISKSYAVEFEKGKHQISTYILLEILQNLSIEIDEFLFIANNYNMNEKTYYDYTYSKLANKHDIEGLEDLLKTLKSREGRLNDIRIAEVRSRLRILRNFRDSGVYDTNVILQEDRQTILTYLIERESWTLQEIKLFANTLDLLDNESIFILFKRVSRVLEYYADLEKGKEIYCALIINLLEYTFKKKQYDYTEVLLIQLDLLSSNYKEFFYRTVYNFFEGLLVMKKLDQEKGRAIAENMLDIMKKLNQEPLAMLYALLLI